MAAQEYFKDTFLCLQADAWTSQSQKSVLGISASFYDPIADKIQTVVLSMTPLVKGKTTSELAGLLNSSLKDLDIKKSLIMQTISYQERSLKNAFSNQINLENMDENCLAHALQTVVKHGFALNAKDFKRDPFPKAFSFWKRVKAVVAYFSSSLMKLRQLNEIQRQKGFKVPLAILKFSSTRWGGGLKVLRRLLRLKEVLDKYFQESSEDLTNLVLTAEEWKSIPQIIALLDPFERVTTYLQFRKISISSYKSIFLDFISSILADAQTGSEIRYSEEEGNKKTVKITSSLPKLMLSKTIKFFDKTFKGEVEEQTLISMFLDPRTHVHLRTRFKGGSFYEPAKRLLKKAILEEIDDPIVLFSPNEDEEDIDVNYNERDSDDELRADFAYGDLKQGATSRVEQSLQLETHSSQTRNENKVNSMILSFEELPKYREVNPLMYLTEKLKEKHCPLKFFRKLVQQQPQLEVIAKVGRKYLTFQRASAYSESIFSHAEIITTNRRSSCGVKRLNQRQFVRHNLETVEDEFEKWLPRFARPEFLKSLRHVMIDAPATRKKIFLKKLLLCLYT